jgi:hypothetical protein
MGRVDNTLPVLNLQVSSGEETTGNGPVLLLGEAGTLRGGLSPVLAGHLVHSLNGSRRNLDHRDEYTNPPSVPARRLDLSV